LSENAVALGVRWVAAAEGGNLTGSPAFSSSDIKGWSTQQRILFLEHLLSHLAKEESKPFSDAVLRRLDALYSLTNNGNAEIKFRWQSICLRCEAGWIVPHVVSFITSQGRMKYVRPLFRALRRSKAGAVKAIQTFRRHQGLYHSIARKMIQADLKAAAGDDGVSDMFDLSDLSASVWAKLKNGLFWPIVVTGAFVGLQFALRRK